MVIECDQEVPVESIKWLSRQGRNYQSHIFGVRHKGKIKNDAVRRIEGV